MIETFAWETEAGLRGARAELHEPGDAPRLDLRTFYPIGAQQVRLTLPADRRVTRVELLRAESDVPFRVAGGACHVHDSRASSTTRWRRSSEDASTHVPTATSRNVVSNLPQRTMRYQGHARGRVALVSAWAACWMLAAGTAAAQSAVQSADRELAWQASIAGRDHITSAQPMLEGIVEDRIDAEPYAPAVDFALDALIQRRACPARAAGRMAVRRPVEALVFLRSRSRRGWRCRIAVVARTTARLGVVRGREPAAPTRAAGLHRPASDRVARRGVADPLGRRPCVGRRRRKGGGGACGVVGTAPGMPPWPWYRLADVGDGRPLLAGGPRPITWNGP